MPWHPSPCVRGRVASDPRFRAKKGCQSRFHTPGFDESCPFVNACSNML